MSRFRPNQSDSRPVEQGAEHAAQHTAATTTESWAWPWRLDVASR